MPVNAVLRRHVREIRRSKWALSRQDGCTLWLSHVCVKNRSDVDVS